MKFMLITIIVLGILFLSNQKDTPIQALKQNDTILAFGDSLTYGYNANANESYPSVLSHLSGYRIINAGILGDTSADGVKRLPKILKEEKISLIIVCFGGNDIMQRLSMESLKNNLKTMIQMAKEKNIEVLLISVPNLGLFGLSPLGLYEEVATEENITLLSGMMTKILEQPSLKSDQAHPNAKGYKIMAEQIYAKLKEEGFMEN